MLDKIKSDLRISHNKLDSDIADAILACRSDLHNAGITVTENDIDGEGDANILQAVKLYCRWYFDYKDKGTDFLTAYTELKKTLSIAERYKVDE